MILNYIFFFFVGEKKYMKNTKETFVYMVLYKYNCDLIEIFNEKLNHILYTTSNLNH